MNFILSSNECLFEYRNSAEFLIFADTDDLVLSKDQSNLYDLSRKLLLQYPDSASFEFLWRKLEVPISKLFIPQLLNFLLNNIVLLIPGGNPKDFRINAILNSSFPVGDTSYGKSIVIPNRLQIAIVHAPRTDEKRVSPYKHKTLGHEIGSAFHLRNLVYEGDEEGWKKHFHNVTKPLLGDYSEVDGSFQKILENDKDLQKVSYLTILLPYYN